MANTVLQKRPVSLTIICILCLAVIALTILLYVRLYHHNPYAGTLERKWYIIMTLLQLPIIAGVFLMYFLKRTGFWLFVFGKVLFFVLPGIAGSGDTVFGLMAPIFFIETAIFFVLFGTRIKYLR